MDVAIDVGRSIVVGRAAQVAVGALPCHSKARGARAYGPIGHISRQNLIVGGRCRCTEVGVCEDGGAGGLGGG